MERVPPLPFVVRTLYAKGDSDSNGEDLAFHEHELIKVTSFGDGNWWKGTMLRNKTTGYFPKNYVELVEDFDDDLKASKSGNNGPNHKDVVKKETTMMQIRSRDHSKEDLREDNMDFSFQSSRNYYREDPNDPYAPPGPYSSSNNNHHRQSQRSQQSSPLRSSKQQQHHYNHQMDQTHNHSNIQRQMNNHVSDNLQRGVHQRNPNHNKATPPPPPTHSSAPTRHTPSPPPSSSSSSSNNHYHSPLNKSADNLHNSPHYLSSPVNKSQAHRQMEGISSRPRQHRPPVTDHGFMTTSNNNSRVSLNSTGQLPNIPSNINTTLHFSAYPSPASSKQSHPHPPTGSPTKEEYSIPYTADSFGQSNSNNNSSSNLNGQSATFMYSQGTYFQNSLSSNSSSAMFNMSDFSATSAGSFSRHRYEEQLRLSKMNNSASGNNLLVDERKVKNGKGFIKRFFGGDKMSDGSGDMVPALPFNILGVHKEAPSSNDEMQLWIRSKVELHRSATLTIQDRKVRERRIRETESEVILEPHKGISKFNENEVSFGNDDFPTKALDLDGIDFTEVDQAMENIDWNVFQSNAQAGPEGIIRGLGRFRTRIEYARAIFKFCVCYFDVCVDACVISSDKELLYTRDDIARFIHQRKIDSLGFAKVFKSLMDLLKMPCEVIPGVLKLPTVPVRHYWNAVLISGQWRMVDVWTSSIHNPQSREFISDYYSNGQNYTDFYFLNEPLNFIHTHIPTSYEHQHINPPINDRIAHQLPPCFPAFFQNEIEISRFNNSLTRLQDSEMFELDLKIPNDIELNTTVLTPNGAFDSNSLCQLYWSHGQRYAKVKGCLPPGSSTGFINISVGIKGVQLTPVNPHALAMVIPITHSGSNTQFQFLTRMPHNSASSSNDLYVKQPQNRKLVCGADYIFNVLSHAVANVEQSSRFVIAIETPSSRVIRLDVKTAPTVDNSDGYVNWEKKLRCDEVGIWRGLVSVDPSQGSGLCVFAEWSCER